MNCLTKLVAILIAVIAPLRIVEADEPKIDSERLSRLFFVVTDTVLDRHLAPPVRQQMLLSATKALHANTGQEIPSDLSRRISGLATEDDFRKFLAKEISSTVDPNRFSAATIEQVFASALVANYAMYFPAKDSRVQQQLRDNVYVGIGISLHQDGKYPMMMQAFARGPAKRAGAKDKDRILEVNGESMENKDLREVVDVLRGARGTKVTIVVQQPGEQETRTLKLVRDVIPFDTVEGTERLPDDSWKFRIAEDQPVAYLRITTIKSSTVHELRKVAGRLHAEKFRALVLDLSNCSGNGVRHAAMLADALLSSGTIGFSQDGGGTREYKSDSDSLFAGWPMAVLIGQGTIGEAEWLAAAMKDQRRATLVGTPTSGTGVVQSFIHLPDDLGAIKMSTGVLRRADGRTLLANSAYMQQRIRSSTSPSVALPKCEPVGVLPHHSEKFDPKKRFESPAIHKAIEVLLAELNDGAKESTVSE